MRIESLNIYPLKSAKGFQTNEVVVENLGFENDRFYAICNSSNIILTAREFPDLLKIETNVFENELIISYKGISKKLDLKLEQENIEVNIFKKPAFGKTIDNEFNKWLSDAIGFDCKLVKIDKNHLRKSSDHNISFSDLSPIHLITKESVKKINSKSTTKIEIDRFRANIIISGLKPFEEEHITKISIGECEFATVSKTQRCSLITIAPNNGEKSKEPLRTLAKEFSKVEFGIYLVPTKLGIINIDDKIRIETNS